MGYKVTEKYVPPAGQAVAPGEHYTVEDPSSGVSWFRTIYFYRAPGGQEVATDSIGHTLASDGDLFHAVRAVVEQYDADHA